LQRRKMTRKGTGAASASRKLSGDEDVGIYQTPATWLWLAVLYKVNVGTVTTRTSYWSTISSEREAVTVSGESSEYGDVETCRMPAGMKRGQEKQFERGIAASMQENDGKRNKCSSRERPGWLQKRNWEVTEMHTSGSFTPATSNASSPLSRSFLYNYLRANDYPRSLACPVISDVRVDVGDNAMVKIVVDQPNRA
ncbi:unnamed protein product, partial [Aureobasidium pullulans]